MDLKPRYRRVVLVVLAVALAGLVVSACGGSSSSSSSSTGADKMETIEAELKEDISSAGATCTEVASGIAPESARKPAESACGSIQATLEKNVATAASSANGSIDSAIRKIAAECRSKASEMSFGKGAALKLCEELAGLQGG